jgi:hypothetical protein
MAYAPEYYQLRGEMVQLRKAAADKNCSAAPGGPAPGAGLFTYGPEPMRSALRIGTF